MHRRTPIRASSTLLGATLAAGVIAAVASKLRMSRDPAVRHANAIRKETARYREGFFSKGDDRLHYVEAGSGPLVILYHGFPSFWYNWFRQMEALKERYRVVAVDALGAGRSARPADLADYGIDRLAGQLDRLARALAGGQRFILVGHDWGAALAFHYAQSHPHRLRAVIGMSAPPFELFLDLAANDPEQRERSSYMQAFRRLSLADIARSGLPERLYRQCYEGLVDDGSLSLAEAELFRRTVADPSAINGGMNWYRANITDFGSNAGPEPRPENVGRIGVPSLLIWGEEDQTFVASFLDRMNEVADDPIVVRLPGVGHWTSLQLPRLATAAIDEFLDAHAPSRVTPQRGPGGLRPRPTRDGVTSFVKKSKGSCG